MFEEEQDNKIYNLIITRGIDQENDRIHLFCCTPPNTPPRAPTFGRSVITLGNLAGAFR